MELWNQFVALIDGAKLVSLGVLILVNFITGLAVAIKAGKFQLKELADFLRSRVVPYVLGYFSVGLVALVKPEWAAAVTVVWGGIIITLIGAILVNLKELGINLPDALGGK